MMGLPPMIFNEADDFVWGGPQINYQDEVDKMLAKTQHVIDQYDDMPEQDMEAEMIEQPKQAQTMMAGTKQPAWPTSAK